MMSDHSKARESKPSKTVDLHGFYITPFGKKTVTLKGRGAVTDVTIEVDFAAVIKKVIEFFTEHKEIVENVQYTFKLTTAKERVRGKYLDENIRINIDEADFVVVDWTTVNPNVLIEAGYAKGRVKHGIDLSGDDSPPSDRAGIIYISYDPDDLSTLSGKLLPLIPQLISRIESQPRVFDYYDERSTELVARMIARARREICILQTNLETVNADHIDDLAKALQRGVKVSILTLDPQSRYVNERALQLGYKTPTIKVYRTGLQNSIDNTVARLSQFPGFRLRLYNDFPNQLTYLFDDHILASVISRTGRSRKNCAFLLPSSRLPGPKHTFVDHFNQLWENADQEIRAQD
jgi:hypothetical protein